MHIGEQVGTRAKEASIRNQSHHTFNPQLWNCDSEPAETEYNAIETNSSRRALNPQNDSKNDQNDQETELGLG